MRRPSVCAGSGRLLTAARPYDHGVDVDDSRDAGDPIGAVRAGSREVFQVEYLPTSADGRFGIFQLHVEGVPIGDGTPSTAWYPHYRDLLRLCELVETLGPREPERLHLGDTFDHLELTWELTEAQVVFRFTTRPEWDAPPPWAPPTGTWLRVGVTRTYFIDVCHDAESQFRRLQENP
jgi:hypothetical protein